MLYSEIIRDALRRDVVGQERAVSSVVRGVTRAAGGLFPKRGFQCAYLFMGPTGTGKTHLVRSLARALHGDEHRLVIADCTHYAHEDPWLAFVRQLAPLFTVPRHDSQWPVLETPPMSIILVEYLERGPAEVVKALAAAMETGRITLPEGRCGSLRNSLLFLTSSLCSAEILDENPKIGFSGTLEDDESARGRLFKVCFAAAQEKFGNDLLGRLDNIIVFHRLQEEQLAEILERLLGRLDAGLTPRGLRTEFSPSARQFLLDRAARDLSVGARDLVRAYRRFVEFPVSDLMISGRIQPGRTIRVERRPDTDHLHFSLAESGGNGVALATPGPAGEPIPIRWEASPPV